MADHVSDETKRNVSRSSAKRAHTKQANRIRQLIVTGETENLDLEIQNLKDAYKLCEDICAEYECTLTSDKELDKSALYFQEIQNLFIKTM